MPTVNLSKTRGVLRIGNPPIWKNANGTPQNRGIQFPNIKSNIYANLSAGSVSRMTPGSFSVFGVPTNQSLSGNRVAWYHRY